MRESNARASLPRSGFAPTSQARRLSALRQFYRFLVSENLRGDDPSAEVDSPRQGRALPKILSEEEVGALLTAAQVDEGPEALRLAAMKLPVKTRTVVREDW